MSIPGNLTPLFNSGAAAGGYQIERSLRFNSADSAYLSRTPAVAGDRKKWTWAGWVKRGRLGIDSIFGLSSASISPGLGTEYIRFTSSDTIDWFAFHNGSSWTGRLTTSQVFRDPSAWMHIVYAVDLQNATSTDRLKLYVNGTIVTAFSTAAYPNTTDSTAINAAQLHELGRQSSGDYFDGYLADIHFIDGQALTPSSFTEVSATTGQLIPKAYTGSYGTNGFKLSFSDNSSNTATTLGKDTSGNGNNWTPNNLSINAGGPVSVAAASGALPVFNTTDTYGAVKGTGTRTDSLSANLQIALPLYTVITDFSPLAQATTSTTGNTALTFQTSSYKFYGGSMVSTSTGASYGTRVNFNSTISLPSGGWTVEFFAKITNISPNGNSVTVKNSSGAVLDLYHYDSLNSYLIEVYFNGTGSRISGYNTASTYLDWNHYAICYNGSTASLYINGISVGTNSSNIPTQATMFELAGIGWSGNTSYVTDFRIYSTVKYTGNFNPPTSTVNATVAAGNDSLVDTPTSISATDTGVGGVVRGNYCTWNPLASASTSTLSNGNLDAMTGTTFPGTVSATFGMSTGKWYWEITFSGSNYGPYIGIKSTAEATTSYPGQAATSYSWYSEGSSYSKKINNSISVDYSLGVGFTLGDIIGVAFDADAGSLEFYKNGTSQGVAFTSISAGTYVAAVGDGTNAGGPTLIGNFGQRAFAYQTPGTNRPAATFKALCDTNLPAPLTAKPSTVFDIVTYTGTGATQTLPNANSTPSTPLGFSPDFLWFKNRSGSNNHALFDTVRTRSAGLYADLTNAEVTSSAGSDLSSFDATGFTVGTPQNFGSPNSSGASIVAWAWDAGTSTDPSNQAGSITSQVRANVSAGFSVVTYTGNGSSGATVGHGLGVAPQMIILKGRAGTTAANHWFVWHTSLSSGYNINLNLTNAQRDTSAFLSGIVAAPSNSTTFGFTAGSSGIVNVNETSTTYVAYCFAPVVGYSSFGSYTGTSGQNFVHLGFRPKLLMIKNSSNGSYPAYTGWAMFDSSRSTYNVNTNPLWANSSQQEGLRGNGGTVTTPDFAIDLLSNGFCLRDNGASEINLSGNTYIFAAWAENPFAYARAR